MAGGSDSALQTARPLLQTLSDTDKLYLVPGGVGAGSNMKMMHQVLAAIHMLGASEVMGFAAHLGLDARETAGKVLGSGAWTWMLENRFPRMVEEDWNPGASALTIMVKDVVCPVSRSTECVVEKVVGDTDCILRRASSQPPHAKTTSRLPSPPLQNKSSSRLYRRATPPKTTRL